MTVMVSLVLVMRFPFLAANWPRTQMSALRECTVKRDPKMGHPESLGYYC